MLQNYQEIYQGEIFVKSQCIELENSLMDFFQRNLLMLNYQPVDLSKKIWRRDNKTVIVCLVDDISTCSDNMLNVSELFDSNTVVITDNKINVDTDYQVLKLPDSFFGIYYYSPENINFAPKKDINLSVNRINPERLSILFELLEYYDLDEMNINFNCFMHEKKLDQNSLIENFNLNWEYIKSFKYSSHYSTLAQAMPINNHNKSLENSSLDSYLNLVPETYINTNIVAISEKIFRSLLTPVPWTVYSSPQTLAFLKSLDFDTMDDIINHGTHVSVRNYVSNAIKTIEQLKKIDIDKLTNRCLRAAQHNQHLLKTMRQQWPSDFAEWWSSNIKYVI
jgi:hypothetical protein